MMKTDPNFKGTVDELGKEVENARLLSNEQCLAAKLWSERRWISEQCQCLLSSELSRPALHFNTVILSCG
jgi:hypothetical protein